MPHSIPPTSATIRSTRPRHSASSPARDISLQFLDALFARRPPRNVAITLWDGTPWPDDTPRAATLLLKHPGALRSMFGAGTEKALAEAYLHDDFDIAGDFEAAFEIADAFADELGWSLSLSLQHLLRKLPASGTEPNRFRSFFTLRQRRHSVARDRDAVSFHYDLSNDFYRLWLDERMIYSCAYFQNGKQGLDEAQIAKLDYLCRKLRLKPGQRVLDIGCGWGGFAIHAANHYGVFVTGVTLSERQHAEGNARVTAAGLETRVQLLLHDYRELGEQEAFDAIVSVGMAEHVGRENLSGYFQKVKCYLRPGGVFLNHAIGEGVRFQPRKSPSFIDEYVFPDTDLPPIQAVVTEAEKAGFEVRDVENLREHYALTLRHWGQRLLTNHEAALAFVDEPTYRIWRLYMAGGAREFQRSRLAIYQTLLVRLDEGGRANLPLTRAGWYT